MAMRDVRRRDHLATGARVKIVQEKDADTGLTTEGTIGEILSRLIKLSATEIEIESAKPPPGPPDRVVGDGSLAARLLGWTPRYGLQETLKSVLTYWRERTEAEAFA